LTPGITGVWRRQQFLDDLFDAVPIYPLTFEIARRAARIDGETKSRGIAIPFQDLIIGVTALQFDYAAARTNVRRGLTVVPL
jgi:predicted nucleic acid-binding protein